jgi:hypothetical protein
MVNFDFGSLSFESGQESICQVSGYFGFRVILYSDRVKLQVVLSCVASGYGSIRIGSC